MKATDAIPDGAQVRVDATTGTIDDRVLAIRLCYGEAEAVMRLYGASRSMPAPANPSREKPGVHHVYPAVSADAVDDVVQGLRAKLNVRRSRRSSPSWADPSPSVRRLWARTTKRPVSPDSMPPSSTCGLTAAWSTPSVRCISPRTPPRRWPTESECGLPESRRSASRCS